MILILFCTTFSISHIDKEQKELIALCASAESYDHARYIKYIKFIPENTVDGKQFVSYNMVMLMTVTYFTKLHCPFTFGQFSLKQRKAKTCNY